MFDKNVVFSRSAQNVPKIKKCEAQKVLKKGFGELSGSPQAGTGRTQGGQSEGFSKPYENDARKTKKRLRKVWVCVVNKRAPQNDFKTVIFTTPTQSQSVFY